MVWMPNSPMQEQSQSHQTNHNQQSENSNPNTHCTMFPRNIHKTLIKREKLKISVLVPVWADDCLRHSYFPCQWSPAPPTEIWWLIESLKPHSSSTMPVFGPESIAIPICSLCLKEPPVVIEIGWCLGGPHQ